ncbi:MAG TPA: PhzF family phenazine biosynthesis protein [Terriglobales bacterium]|jgi:trans-2,3-dihydro-3-hydroxyanthranilate isomerase|nr:PhzF family phenazine biosynthesis protein [Terriglobales bacterium]
MRRFPFVTLDVFTRKPLEGNQLAVFPDARGLSDAEMQALARETNLSETTFIMPRGAASEREHGIKVRIFTVAEELPFAGHPTLGTAALIHKQRGDKVVTLDLQVGKVPVRFSERDGGMFGEMTQRDPVFGSIHSKEALAREALQCDPADFDHGLPIQTVSTGLAFAIVPLVSVAKLSSLQFDYKRAAAYLEKTDAKFLYFIARDTEVNGNPGLKSFRSRMIFYNGEDPATGSAAGCATAWLTQHGVIASEEAALIEQGVEIKRPSRIYICASKTGDSVRNVRVGGYSVEVVRGELEL